LVHLPSELFLIELNKYREELNKSERDTIKKLGLKLRRKNHWIYFVTLLISPMFLFAGIFFPKTALDYDHKKDKLSRKMLHREHMFAII